MSKRNQQRGLKQKAGQFKKHHAQRVLREAAASATERASAKKAAASAARSAAAAKGARTRERRRQEAVRAMNSMRGAAPMPAAHAAAQQGGARDAAARRIRALLVTDAQGALMQAAEGGFPLLVGLACKGSGELNVNAALAPSGLTPLLLLCGGAPAVQASTPGLVGAARALLHKGAALDAQCVRGISALGYARQLGNADLVAFLTGKDAHD